jgi:hypothetical protein
MKAGTPLEALAKEVERRIATKDDYVAPVSRLSMQYENEPPNEGGKVEPVMELALSKKQTRKLPLTLLAHEQMAEYLGIPTAYYKRMLNEQPGLLTENVNIWLPTKTTKVRVGKGEVERVDQRMVRTLDGKVRAVLSDGYRKLENEDLMEAVLPVLTERNLQIISCDLTERRLYLKAIDRAVSREIPRGAAMGDGSHHILHSDTVYPIVVISNSEVGDGALRVEGGGFTDWCTNLAIFNARMRKYHTGARAEVSDDAYQLLSDATKRLTDAAVWAQVRDLVKVALDETNFDQQVELLREATTQPIEDDPVKVVERVAKRYSFTEGTKTGVFKRLVEGADLTRYGLHAAVTRASADEKDYDEATRMERIGGQIIELPKSDWREIAEGYVEKKRRQAA